MFGQVLRPVLRRAPKGTRSYKVVDYGEPHMNDLPVPQGSWQENYNKKQAKGNMQLLFAIGALVGSITLARLTGNLYLNASPPTPK